MEKTAALKGLQVANLKSTLSTPTLNSKEFVEELFEDPMIQAQNACKEEIEQFVGTLLPSVSLTAKSLKNVTVIFHPGQVDVVNTFSHDQRRPLFFFNANPDSSPTEVEILRLFLQEKCELRTTLFSRTDQVYSQGQFFLLKSDLNDDRSYAFEYAAVKSLISRTKHAAFVYDVGVRSGRKSPVESLDLFEILVEAVQDADADSDVLVTPVAFSGHLESQFRVDFERPFSLKKFVQVYTNTRARYNCENTILHLNAHLAHTCAKAVRFSAEDLADFIFTFKTQSEERYLEEFSTLREYLIDVKNLDVAFSGSDHDCAIRGLERRNLGLGRNLIAPFLPESCLALSIVALSKFPVSLTSLCGLGQRLANAHDVGKSQLSQLQMMTLHFLTPLHPAAVPPCADPNRVFDDSLDALIQTEIVFKTSVDEADVHIGAHIQDKQARRLAKRIQFDLNDNDESEFAEERFAVILTEVAVSKINFYIRLIKSDLEAFLDAVNAALENRLFATSIWADRLMQMGLVDDEKLNCNNIDDMKMLQKVLMLLCS